MFTRNKHKKSNKTKNLMLALVFAALSFGASASAFFEGCSAIGDGCPSERTYLCRAVTRTLGETVECFSAPYEATCIVYYADGTVKRITTASC